MLQRITAGWLNFGDPRSHLQKPVSGHWPRNIDGHSHHMNILQCLYEITHAMPQMTASLIRAHSCVFVAKWFLNISHAPTPVALQPKKQAAECLPATPE